MGFCANGIWSWDRLVHCHRDHFRLFWMVALENVSWDRFGSFPRAQLCRPHDAPRRASFRLPGACFSGSTTDSKCLISDLELWTSHLADDSDSAWRKWAVFHHLRLDLCVDWYVCGPSSNTAAFCLAGQLLNLRSGLVLYHHVS